MKRLMVILLLLISLVSVSLVLSAPSSLDISWWTVDGGGTSPKLQGGPYTLRGTTGQADAGMHSANSYSLSGGYWNPLTGSATSTLYLPVIYRP